MGRRNLIAVWAATAALLVTSVVAYAVTADDREPTALRTGDASADSTDRADGVDDWYAPPGEVPAQIAEDRPAIPGVILPPDAIPHVGEPRIPSIPPPPPDDVPALPRPRPRTQPMPAPAPPHEPAPARPDLNGADCGTPWGYGGYGAENSKTIGTATVRVQIYHCHSYDGEVLQNFVVWEDAHSVAIDVDMDFGDGTKVDNRYGGWACSDPNVGKPSHHSSSPHTYAAPGRYQVTATVTYQPCQAGQPTGEAKTTTIAITAFRHAGQRPD